MLYLAVLSVLVGGAVGGRSPNAGFIEKTYGAASGAKYSTDILEDATLDVPDLITRYGYPVETREVTTADDYILTMHRIPHGRDKNNEPGVVKPVVFIMHGLLSSSADFVVLGPGSALAYYLAEEGYDVWLGNARGNYYSRRHLRLNPDSITQSFWRFSWDQIGNFDLPAFIDYILDTTQQSKLHYVGHSQGGTTFLVLTSLRPEYNEKIISFQGLAPAALFTYNTNEVFRTLAPLENVLEAAAFTLGLAEAFPDRDFLEWFTTNYCVPESIFYRVCDAISIGGSSQYINETMLPIFHGHAPAGASIRQIAHYGQSIRFNTFRRYNFNTLTNLAQYGSTNPPNYDLSKITVPAYIYYATADTFVYPEDTLLLCDRLPNLEDCYLLPSDHFGHLDFIWGSITKTLVYERVLKQMRNAEQNSKLLLN